MISFVVAYEIFFYTIFSAPFSKLYNKSYEGKNFVSIRDSNF